MKIKILGSGTSSGVPVIGCRCDVCMSADPHDRRLRCSSLIEVGSKNILIDCTPDFREQMLSVDFAPLDAVLITHEHYDHVGGLDDLRPYSIFGDVNVYAEQYCVDRLMERIPYCFTPKEKRYPGVPAINLISVAPHMPFVITKAEDADTDFIKKFLDAPMRESRRRTLMEYQQRKAERLANGEEERDIEVIPLRVMHGKLPIIGYRIENLAYITDMKTIPDTEYEYLKGIDTLIVNGLRHEEHPSHQTIEDAINFAQTIGAKETYIIHMSHHISKHEDEQRQLPPHFHLAYDGMEIIC